MSSLTLSPPISIPLDVPIQLLNTGFSPILAVPSTVWANIFSYLNTQEQAHAAFTCRKFRYILATDPQSKLYAVMRLKLMIQGQSAPHTFWAFPELCFNRIRSANRNYMLFFDHDPAPISLLVIHLDSDTIHSIFPSDLLKPGKFADRHQNFPPLLAADCISESTIATCTSAGCVEWWEFGGILPSKNKWHCVAREDLQLPPIDLSPDVQQPHHRIGQRKGNIIDQKLYISSDGIKGQDSCLDVFDLKAKQTVGHYEFKRQLCPDLSVIHSNVIYSLEPSKDFILLRAICLKDNQAYEVQWESCFPPEKSLHVIGANDHWLAVGKDYSRSWSVFSSKTGQLIWNYIAEEEPIQYLKTQSITRPWTLWLYRDFIISQEGYNIKIWDIWSQKCCAVINTQKLLPYDPCAPLAEFPFLQIVLLDQEIRVAYLNKEMQLKLARYQLNLAAL